MDNYAGCQQRFGRWRSMNRYIIEPSVFTPFVRLLAPLSFAFCKVQSFVYNFLASPHLCIVIIGLHVGALVPYCSLALAHTSGVAWPVLTCQGYIHLPERFWYLGMRPLLRNHAMHIEYRVLGLRCLSVFAIRRHVATSVLRVKAGAMKYLFGTAILRGGFCSIRSSIYPCFRDEECPFPAHFDVACVYWFEWWKQVTAKC